jgi:hypothetical protein
MPQHHRQKEFFSPPRAENLRMPGMEGIAGLSF